MIKGCQRRIYHIKNTSSPIFEEAYFVLKKRSTWEYTPGLNHINDSEMAAEAERIIAEVCRGCSHKPAKQFPRMNKASAFALGALSSSAVIGLSALLLVYL